MAEDSTQNNSQNQVGDGQMQINSAPVNPAPAAIPAMPNMPAAGTPVEAAPAASAAVPAAPVAAANENDDNKNVFTELFGNDQSQKNGALMNTVLTQQDQKSKSMFGQDAKGLSDLKKVEKKLTIRRSGPGKLLLRTAVILMIATVGYFFVQNWTDFTWFGANMAQKATLAEEQVSSLNDEITVQKFLSATLLLDHYSSFADEYFYYVDQVNSDYVSANKKTDFKESATTLRPTIVSLLEQAQEYLKGDLAYDDRLAAESLVDELVAQLHAKSGDVNQQTLLQDIQDLETTKALFEAIAFRKSLTDVDLTKVSDEDLKMIYSGYSEVSASLTAIINTIKSDRVSWSYYLNEIEVLTKKVDPLFNTEYGGTLVIGDIKLGGDGITLTGQTSTEDSKNFTLISNLIDTYESSSTFMNVQERSYSKSGSDDEFTGSFRITMQIEDLTQNK